MLETSAKTPVELFEHLRRKVLTAPFALDKNGFSVERVFRGELGKGVVCPHPIYAWTTTDVFEETSLTSFIALPMKGEVISIAFNPSNNLIGLGYVNDDLIPNAVKQTLGNNISIFDPLSFDNIQSLISLSDGLNSGRN